MSYIRNIKVANMSTAPPIQVKRTYQLPIRDVWEIITTQAYLSQWLMPGNFKAELGHSYIFNCEPNDTCGDGKVYGEVLEVNPPHSITFTWNSKDVSQETVVEFKLEESSDGVCFNILHKGFATKDQDAIDAHTTGWNFHQSEIEKIQSVERS